MLVNEVISKLLEDVGYNVFYILKPDGFDLDSYITFDTTIKNNWYSSNTNEAELYFVTINIITKNANEMPLMIRQIKDIVDKNPYCAMFINEGNTYIKDTREFFSACTFYYYVFPSE